MNAEDPFLPRVLTSPADQRLRLVYADWLEERGDRRGELIRVCAEMAGLRPYDDRYGPLRARRNDLRRQVDPAWLSQMGYVPTHRPLFTRLPRERHQRWRLVEEFIDVWYGSLKEGDGVPEQELDAAERRLGRKLPAALREWYALAGNRPDIWSRQDRFVIPPSLKFDTTTDTLIIRLENQACERWGIPVRDLDRADPPVIHLSEPSRRSPTVTAFAAQVLLYEAKFYRRVIWAGMDAFTPDLEAEIAAKYARCELPTDYWAATPLQFYEGTDLILENHQVHWLYVAARTEAAYLQLDVRLRRQLERYH
jgi:uncharacterized protein (TIGR02996 family)